MVFLPGKVTGQPMSRRVSRGTKNSVFLMGCINSMGEKLFKINFATPRNDLGGDYHPISPWEISSLSATSFISPFPPPLLSILILEILGSSRDQGRDTYKVVFPTRDMSSPMRFLFGTTTDPPKKICPHRITNLPVITTGESRIWFSWKSGLRASSPPPKVPSSGLGGPTNS